MAYRLVYSSFWEDPTTMDEMTSEDRYFYLYLLTNPAVTSIGIYFVTRNKMAFELGQSVENVDCLIERFEKCYKLIKYSPETREIAIKNWGKYNLNRGGKPMMDCWASELSKVKNKSLIEYVLRNIVNETIRKLYQSFIDTDTTRTGEVAPQVDNTNTCTNTCTNTDTSTYTKTGTSIDTYTLTGKSADTSTSINTSADEDTTVNTDIDLNTVTKITANPPIDDLQNKAITILQEYEKLTGRVAVLNLAAIKLAVRDYGEDRVRMAINKALVKGKLKMNYVNGILRTWAKEGYPEGGEQRGDRSSFKNTADGKAKYGDFKPKEPRSLDSGECRALQEELL